MKLSEFAIILSIAYMDDVIIWVIDLFSSSKAFVISVNALVWTGFWSV